MAPMIHELRSERGKVEAELAGLEDELKPLARPAASPPAPASTAGAIEVFYSYAHEDEALRDGLNKHLKLLERQGVISTWHDRRIGAGTEWAGRIDIHLNSAGIILLLIRADFIASDYCWDVELARPISRTRLNLTAP